MSLGARDADAPPAAPSATERYRRGPRVWASASGRPRTQRDAELASRVAPERVHVPGGGEHDAVTVGGGDGDDSYPLEGPRDSPGRRRERFVAASAFARLATSRGVHGGTTTKRPWWTTKRPTLPLPVRHQHPSLLSPTRTRARTSSPPTCGLASRHRHTRSRARPTEPTDRVGTPNVARRGETIASSPAYTALTFTPSLPPGGRAPRVHSPVGGCTHGVKLTGGCADDAAARFPRHCIPGPARPSVIVVVGPNRGSVRGWDRHGDVVDASRRRLLAHRARAELKVDAAAPRVQIARQGRRRRRRRRGGGGGCGGAG